MTEQKKQFTKLKRSIGKTTPQELGKMFREYYKEFRKEETAPYSEAVKIFDGKLFTS